jgi:CrcB protein
VPRAPDEPQAASLFAAGARSRWPSLRADVLAAVFLGGCVGGWARFAVVSGWPTSAGRFPWATFGVNAFGAFILAVVIVLATQVSSSRYLRPLLGTGFCGALTTFSSIVVSTDQLIAHHHGVTAVVYLLASITAGLAAMATGLMLARAAVGNRSRAGEGRTAL